MTAGYSWEDKLESGISVILHGPGPNEVNATSPQRDPTAVVHVGVVGEVGPGQCECFDGYVGATCATTQ